MEFHETDDTLGFPIPISVTTIIPIISRLRKKCWLQSYFVELLHFCLFLLNILIMIAPPASLRSNFLKEKSHYMPTKHWNLITINRLFSEVNPVVPSSEAAGGTSSNPACRRTLSLGDAVPDHVTQGASHHSALGSTRINYCRLQSHPAACDTSCLH